MFTWKSQKRPMLCLAPMEGYTDSSYRQIIKSVAPSVICFTEFTSADGLRYGSKKSFQKIEFKETERPLIAQVFGSVPEKLAESAKILEDMGVDGVDINMGCPTRKVTRICQGSALFKYPQIAQEIVNQIKKATKLNVSVKLRIGYGSYNEDEFIAHIKGLESAGVKHFSIHGRTTAQLYTGLADWEPIYKAKQVVTEASVVGNGDVKSVEDFAQKLQNLDGIMIGRGTYGNPWLMAEIEHYIKGEKYDAPTTFNEKVETILLHCRLSCELKGERTGMLEMRKHLANYVHGMPNASHFRTQLIQVSTLGEAELLLKNIVTQTMTG